MSKINAQIKGDNFLSLFLRTGVISIQKATFWWNPNKFELIDQIDLGKSIDWTKSPEAVEKIPQMMTKEKFYEIYRKELYNKNYKFTQKECIDWLEAGIPYLELNNGKIPLTRVIKQIKKKLDQKSYQYVKEFHPYLDF